jgi:Raf kinase inhibitor-like YbhB/YbcL family protein
MTQKTWGLGFLGALVLAGGVGAKPIDACLRPLLNRSIDPSIYRSLENQASGTQQQSGAQQQQGQRGATPPPGGRGGRGAVAVMTLATTAWTDGRTIALKYTQARDEVSPPLTWSGAPETTASFVLIVRDLDAMRGNDDTLHWLVWNIPGKTTSLPEAIPHGPQLPDGMRQISATGPYYRGPAAPASGPPHHYVFELYALDSLIDVPPVGASPAETRAAVIAAMAGHIRGKASLVGLFKRGS